MIYRVGVPMAGPSPGGPHQKANQPMLHNDAFFVSDSVLTFRDIFHQAQHRAVNRLYEFRSTGDSRYVHLAKTLNVLMESIECQKEVIDDPWYKEATIHLAEAMALTPLSRSMTEELRQVGNEAMMIMAESSLGGTESESVRRLAALCEYTSRRFILFADDDWARENVKALKRAVLAAKH